MEQNRIDAMKWWNSITPSYKKMISPRKWDTLTSREIERLYNEKNKTDAKIIDMAFDDESKNKGTQKSPFGFM